MVAPDDNRDVVALYCDVGVRCLRCTSKFPVRQFGLEVIQAAEVKAAMGRKGSTGTGNRTIDRDVRTALVRRLRDVVEALLGRRNAHHAVLRLCTDWFVENLYVPAVNRPLNPRSPLATPTTPPTPSDSPLSPPDITTSSKRQTATRTTPRGWT